MATFNLTIPIAGHAFIQVEADNAKAAVEKAFEEITLQDIEDWETLKRFVTGNVCHCPSPWEIYVEDENGDEVDADDDGERS